MNERSPTPLAITVLGLLLAVISYAIQDQKLAGLVYGCGLVAAILSVVDWFLQPVVRRR